MDSGPLLRQARESAGLSLRDLAERAGTSAATLCLYETGRKEPRLSTLERLCDATGADLLVEIRPRLSRTERFSLALHRAVAERLATNPAHVLGVARRNLAALRQQHAGGGATAYLDDWERLLAGPMPPLVEVLTSTAQHARDLRSASPFAGVLTDAARRRILAETRAEVR